MPEVCCDLAALVGPFRDRVEALIKRMKDRGHVARVHETMRSKERSEALVRAGKSRVRGGPSMHCYGVAADLICHFHLWECRKHGCGFFEALGHEARLLGLTWGGDWDGDGDLSDQSFNDRPHTQAVPLRTQHEIWAAKSKDEIVEIARRALGDK